MPEPARLASDRVIYSFSPEHPPAIIVESGDRIVIETRDAYDRQFQGNLDINSYLRERNSRPSNPATGPIFVRGVAPGDGLDVTIEKIELGETGYVAAVPGIGVLGDTRYRPVCISEFEVRDDADSGTMAACRVPLASDGWRHWRRAGRRRYPLPSAWLSRWQPRLQRHHRGHNSASSGPGRRRLARDRRRPRQHGLSAKFTPASISTRR